MPEITPRAVDNIHSLKTILAEIHFNVQRGGRAGAMDIDDWAKMGLEIVDYVLKGIK